MPQVVLRWTPYSWYLPKPDLPIAEKLLAFISHLRKRRRNLTLEITGINCVFTGFAKT